MSALECAALRINAKQEGLTHHHHELAKLRGTARKIAAQTQSNRILLSYGKGIE
jgi:hypothetical protein